MPKIAVVMGSDSDITVMKEAFGILEKFGIQWETRIISAHRTPGVAAGFAKGAQQSGIDIIIAAAGKAAHLPGVLAAMTPVPVVGVPIRSSFMDGLDSLLSIVQMPDGIPVATVGINGSKNAALLAVQILSLKYPELNEMLIEYREDMAKRVAEKDAKVRNNKRLIECSEDMAKRD